jgi:hypothetical protein
MCSDIDNWDNFVYSNYIYEVAITTSLFINASKNIDAINKYIYY